MDSAELKRGLPPAHPGEMLREVILPALKVEQGIGKGAFADKLGTSRNNLDLLLKEKIAVSPEMAARLGKLLGNGGRFWLNLQATYDLMMAEQRLSVELAAIPTLEVAA